MSKFSRWVGKRVGKGPSVSGLKSSIKGTGKLAAKVAPVAAFINPALGAGLAGLGNLAAGKNIGESLVSAGKTYGLGKLGQSGVKSVKGLLHGGSQATSAGADLATHGVDLAQQPGISGYAANATGGWDAIPNTVAASAPRSVSSLVGDTVGKVGGWIKDHPGDAAKTALAVAQGVNALGQQGQADRAMQDANRMAMETWNAKGPLRAMSLDQLMFPKAPDVSDLRSITNRGNPYAPGYQVPRRPLAPKAINALMGGG